jgi:hypothetical protein
LYEEKYGNIGTRPVDQMGCQKQNFEKQKMKKAAKSKILKYVVEKFTKFCAVITKLQIKAFLAKVARFFSVQHTKTGKI